MATITQKQTAWAKKKTGADTSYDHLWKAEKDCLVPVKLLFFKEVAKKINGFMLVFQSDKPMAPFLMETLEDVIKTLVRKYIFKDFHDKSCSEMAKLDFNDVNNQKPTHLVDLGLAVTHEIQLLKISKKITDSQILKLKKRSCGVFSNFVHPCNGKEPSEIIFLPEAFAVYLQIISESALKLVRTCLIKFCLSWSPTRLLLLILLTALSHSTASLLLPLSKRIRQNV